MESREALVEALTEYSGAVILVSAMTCTCLDWWPTGCGWSKDGAVNPTPKTWRPTAASFLRATRRRRSTSPLRKSPERASREEVAALRAEVKKCEERIDKLNQMRDRLATKLAEPALYDQARVGELETWQKKYAEVMEGLDRAEAMWLKAEARLESAGV
jgi:ATP-binding cassette, subfamily F, member 3